MTTHPSPARTPSPDGPRQDPHRSLHSQTGGLRGEHPGRSSNPLVKVAGLAWLEFEKPDLDRAERFGTDFGFTVADRTPEMLLLRGRRASAGCLVIRRGPRPRFVGTLRLTLRVNGEVRQDNTVAADMLVRPARALTLLSRFQPLAPGDLLLTGTPGGTALTAPGKITEKVTRVLPPATRWKLFFKRQVANPRYLHDGDVITATIASPDGQLDLGTQHNTIIGKLS